MARLPRHGGGEIFAGANQLRDEFAHANAISPLPNGDIYISFRRLNTIGLIDRATGKMKWEHRDDSFGMQHDCAPLPNGNITLFANGINTTTNPFSRVIELDPRTHKTVWEYRAKPSYTFFSPHISGAERLGSGNTLICEGQWGRLFEVTPEGEIVWEYVSPFMGLDRNGDPSEQYSCLPLRGGLTPNPQQAQVGLRLGRNNSPRLLQTAGNCQFTPFRNRTALGLGRVITLWRSHRCARDKVEFAAG